MLTHEVERVAFTDTTQIDLNTWLPELNGRRRSIEQKFLTANQRLCVLDFAVGRKPPFPFQESPTARQWTTRDVECAFRFVMQSLAERKKIKQTAIYSNGMRGGITVYQADSALFLEDRQPLLNLFDFIECIARD